MEKQQGSQTARTRSTTRLVSSSAPREDLVHPDELRKSEQALIDARRESFGPSQNAFAKEHQVGAALSGGGIRSATFALGFFQGLARSDALKYVDYVSTVSGGGYFGGFLGSLFAREEIENPEQVRRVLAEEPNRPALPKLERFSPVRYLRDNGRYLTPGGARDAWLGATVVLRNLLALHFVLWGAAVLACAVVAFLSHRWGYYLWSPSFLDEIDAAKPLSLSPLLWMSAGALVVFSIPFGLSYWMIGTVSSGITEETYERVLAPLILYTASAAVFLVGAWVPRPLECTHIHPLVTAVLSGGTTSLVSAIGDVPADRTVACLANALSVLLASAYAVRLVAPYRVPLAWLMPLMVGPALVALERSYSPLVVLACAGVVLTVLGLIEALRGRGSDGAPAARARVECDHRARDAVSRWLKGSLVAACGLFLVGLIDSAIETTHEWGVTNAWSSLSAAAGTAGFVTALRWVAEKFAVNARSANDRLPQWVVDYLPRVLGVLLLLATVLASGLIAHVVLYDGSHGATSEYWLYLLMALVVFVGGNRAFINRSGHHAYYSVRLTRAFLGASNPERCKNGDAKGGAFNHRAPDLQADTRRVDNDDLSSEDYWRRPTEKTAEGSPSSPKSPFEKGAPLHLINVTINETVGSQSQVAERDRKGMNLALGPSGLTVGARHHAVFDWGSSERPTFIEGQDFQIFSLPRGQTDLVLKCKDSVAEGLSKARDHLTKKGRREGPRFPKDRLSIGSWIGISGAAISTGLGSRTNFGLSILACVANIRLGYWWRPGARRPITLTRALGALAWVQTYLVRELFGLFPGTSNYLWYLSDGGHFENLGAYELVRRRVRFILVVDAEADPDYAFDSLGALVHKARTDFDAEVEFLSDEPGENGLPALSAVLDGPSFNHVGELEQLRRGAWGRAPRRDVRGPNPSGPTQVWSLNGSDRAGLSLAHAALARISYADSDRKSWLLYVKPSLVGTEAQDIQRYHSQHPSFPHEPTADQSFGEDQWECYRKLGEQIAERLFPKNDASEASVFRLLDGKHGVFAPPLAADSAEAVAAQ